MAGSTPRVRYLPQKRRRMDPPFFSATPVFVPRLSAETTPVPRKNLFNKNKHKKPKVKTGNSIPRKLKAGKRAVAAQTNEILAPKPQLHSLLSARKNFGHPSYSLSLFLFFFFLGKFILSHEKTSSSKQIHTPPFIIPLFSSFLRSFPHKNLSSFTLSLT